MPAAKKSKKAGVPEKPTTDVNATTEQGAMPDASSTAQSRKRTKQSGTDVAPPPKRLRQSARLQNTVPAAEAAPSTRAPAKGKATTKKPQAKSKKKAAAVPEPDTARPKPRHEPPLGGETTKISSDDQAAADQLEGELIEIAKAEGAEGGDKTISGPKRFWLMKAEQEDREEQLKSGRMFNTKFTIDDLRAKTEPEPWDGVRNVVAAKNMREMKQGDLAFFYASGGKGGRKPGIVGIMEVVKEHEPDLTVSDEDAYGYVEKESDRKKWCVVHVEYRRKLSKPVHLSELQKYSRDGGVLASMQVLNTARLSVTKVSKAEWDFIVNELVEGYEEDKISTPIKPAVPI